MSDAEGHSTLLMAFLLFFFFQAEDGIRDHCVTGVQTCALPILVRLTMPPFANPQSQWSKENGAAKTLCERIERQKQEAQDSLMSLGWHRQHLNRTVGEFEQSRSEERRVGKECRSRWSPYH